MTATIAYDKPVANFIDQLSATGHVTHTAYKKKSVTLHHNGGRLSHQGVLNVWKTRPASAHFDADGVGAIAQYVKVNEYAWAVGDLQGNKETISIEMANASTGGDWPVAEVTWKAAARLAGWLFAKVIGERPTKNNLFYHHHWSSTACAGPYMDGVYTKVLTEAQKAYDSFVKKPTTPSSPSPSTPGKKSITEVAKDVIDGDYGNDPSRSKKLKAEGYDPAKVQTEVNRLLKKPGSAPSKPASKPTKKSVDAIAKEVIAGKWDNGPTRVRKLIAAGYNASAVQKRVDEMLNPPKGPKSIKTLAAEVLAGKWGNDPSRSRDLSEAGYDPKAVQAEVNRQAKARR